MEGTTEIEFLSLGANAAFALLFSGAGAVAVSSALCQFFDKLFEEVRALFMICSGGGSPHTVKFSPSFFKRDRHTAFHVL